MEKPNLDYDNVLNDIFHNQALFIRHKIENKMECELFITGPSRLHLNYEEVEELVLSSHCWTNVAMTKLYLDTDDAIAADVFEHLKALHEDAQVREAGRHLRRAALDLHYL